MSRSGRTQEEADERVGLDQGIDVRDPVDQQPFEGSDQRPLLLVDARVGVGEIKLARGRRQCLGRSRLVPRPASEQGKTDSVDVPERHVDGGASDFGQIETVVERPEQRCLAGCTVGVGPKRYRGGSAATLSCSQTLTDRAGTAHRSRPRNWC